LAALVPVALITMAVLPFMRDESHREARRWDAGAGAALRREVDHMPSDAELSPLVKMGTRLNRDALKAFLDGDDNVALLAGEVTVKAATADGDPEAAATAAASGAAAAAGAVTHAGGRADADAGGMTEQSKQNAALMHFGGAVQVDSPDSLTVSQPELKARLVSTLEP
jgi:hypothetical protein